MTWDRSTVEGALEDRQDLPQFLALCSVIGKKGLPAAVDRKRELVDPDHPHLSISRQCELLDLNRSTYYLPPATASEENLRLMRLIDRQ
jgi:hypothetical protein